MPFLEKIKQMNGINFFKKLYSCIEHIVLFLLAFAIVCMLFLWFQNPDWLDIDSCQDLGKVWDRDEKRCRDDCLVWKADFGCIKLTAEQSEKYKNCATSSCFSSEDNKDICLQNNKAWNEKQQVCDFYFKQSDCFKKGEDWFYPPICK